MKRGILTLIAVFLLVFSSNAQKVEFEEYDLNNGMHVILHQDNAAPVVTVEIMYDVVQLTKKMVKLAWPIFMNICYLQEQKISQEENGAKYNQQGVEVVMLQPVGIEQTITNLFHLMN